MRAPAARLALPLALGAACCARAQKRLLIRNGCDRESIWIAHEAASPTGIGPDKQNVEIKPGAEFAFQTPAGLAATRYWPKMGCDASGGNCTLGGSGGPGEACVKRPPEVSKDDYSDCAPPIDTKFEGTFGNAAVPCNDQAAQGCDYVDMSLVDGWTLPFKLELKGYCVGRTGPTHDLVIDCQGLTLDQCPQDEVLTAAGNRNVDLRAFHPHTKQVAGCHAPCQKLISDKWGSDNPVGAAHPTAAPYCCPTPPESPEACRSGPIIKTKFLGAVHGRCPGVYGYAYDDGMGLLRCSPTTYYDLTFMCPDDKTNFQEGRKRNEAEQKAKAEEAKQRAEEAKQKAEEAKQRAEEEKKQKEHEKAEAEDAAESHEDTDNRKSEEALRERNKTPNGAAQDHKANLSVDETTRAKPNASAANDTDNSSDAGAKEMASSCIVTSVIEGISGQNACPAGTVPLSKDECAGAPKLVPAGLPAEELHKPFEVNSPSDPVGCYRFAQWVYWNRHPVGANMPLRNRLCRAECKDGSVMRWLQRLDGKAQVFSLGRLAPEGRLSWAAGAGAAALCALAALALVASKTCVHARAFAVLTIERIPSSRRYAHASRFGHMLGVLEETSPGLGAAAGASFVAVPLVDSAGEAPTP